MPISFAITQWLGVAKVLAVAGLAIFLLNSISSGASAKAQNAVLRDHAVRQTEALRMARQASRREREAREVLAVPVVVEGGTCPEECLLPSVSPPP